MGISYWVGTLPEKENTKLDEAVNRAKNSKYLVPVLLIALVVGGVAATFESICTIRSFIGLPCETNEGAGLPDDVRAVLEDRATTIVEWHDDVIASIETANLNFQQLEACNLGMNELTDLDATTERDPLCETVARETFELMMSIREARDDFTALHERHLEHLDNGNVLAAHETASSIFELIENTGETILAGVVGYGDNTGSDILSDETPAYFHGHPQVVINLRFESPEEVFHPYTDCIESLVETGCME